MYNGFITITTMKPITSLSVSVLSPINEILFFSYATKIKRPLSSQFDSTAKTEHTLTRDKILQNKFPFDKVVFRYQK